MKTEYKIKFDYKTKTIIKTTITTQEIKLNNIENNNEKVVKFIEQQTLGDVIGSFYGWSGYNFYFVKTADGIIVVENDDKFGDPTGMYPSYLSKESFKGVILGKCFSEDEWDNKKAGSPVTMKNMPKIDWRED